MRSLGAKTAAIVVLFMTVLACAAKLGKLQLEWMQSLSGPARFTIGFFSILAGHFLFSFWELGKPSGSHFRVFSGNKMQEGEVPLLEFKGFGIATGPLRPPVLELPPLWLRGFSFLAVFLLAILCFDSRTVAVMRDTPRRLSHVTQFCPAEEPSAVPRPVEAKPGCELVNRAFELGLVKSLGSCESEEVEVKLKLCTLRQSDEPLLHYFVRQTAEFMERTKKAWSGVSLKTRMHAVFQRQLEFFSILSGKLRHVVKNTPRSSHHIFTNLAPPGGGALGRDCFSKYQRLSHTIDVRQNDPRATSRIFDHTYGQLLFNPKYDEVAGLCAEYTIHWNSPVDSCEKLSQNPTAFLRGIGALNEVVTVFNRVEEERALKRLRMQLTSIETGIPPPPPPPASAIPLELRPHAYASPDTVISFQCFMQGGKAQAQTRTLVLNGTQFSVRDVQFVQREEAQKVHVGMYKDLAGALVDDLKYSANASFDGAAVGSRWRVTPELLSGADFPFTNLEYLKGADIFSDNEWLQRRNDLLEIYPYYHHLYHFIELFRQQYRTQRTRL